MKGFIWILVIILATIILQPEVTPNLISSSHGNANPMNHATRVALSTKESEELNAGYAVVSRDTPVQNTNTEVGSMGTIECSFNTNCRNLRKSGRVSGSSAVNPQTIFSSEGYARPVPGILTQGPHGRNNSGLDMRAAVGTIVRAAAAGEVIQVSRYRTSGLFIRIEHENCARTFYGHLSRQMVRVGDVVSRGQVIGLSGNTGRTTGPHLHFAVDSTRSQC